MKVTVRLYSKAEQVISTHVFLNNGGKLKLTMTLFSIKYHHIFFQLFTRPPNILLCKDWKLTDLAIMSAQGRHVSILANMNTDRTGRTVVIGQKFRHIQPILHAVWERLWPLDKMVSSISPCTFYTSWFLFPFFIHFIDLMSFYINLSLNHF